MQQVSKHIRDPRSNRPDSSMVQQILILRGHNISIEIFAIIGPPVRLHFSMILPQSYLASNLGPQWRIKKLLR